MQRGGEVKMIPCPEVTATYHRGKAGVDTFDQFWLAHYSLEMVMVSRKWWHKLFFGRLGSTAVNAWIIAVTNDKKLVHRTWVQQLHVELVTNPMAVKLTVPRLVTRTNVVQAVEITTKKSSMPCKAGLPHAQTRLMGKHFPQWLKQRGECEGCRALYKQRKLKRPSRTSLHCKRCDVYICFKCWEMWHTQSRIEYVDFGGKRNVTEPAKGKKKSPTSASQPKKSQVLISTFRLS
jgi:hypothetical protein